MASQVEDAAREAAHNRVKQAEVDAAKVSADPGATFKFLAGKPLPTGFKNPPCGTQYHRCVDRNGMYHPDWLQFRVYKTDTTQAEIIHVHAASVRRGQVAVACHNNVKTGVWMDAPKAVVAVIREARRETVDMATTDHEGNQLGLTGPQRIFRVVEDRPQYNCEVMASA